MYLCFQVAHDLFCEWVLKIFQELKQQYLQKCITNYNFGSSLIFSIRN